ncbi:hypothetical protein SAMN04487868_112105 [Marinobacter salarius]|jgi:hypothetical protein|uniref:Uncharacterized protein n=1 Tax=Marinobacter salarius TaxID=1420917 RepID=A0ABY1FQI2_9GAMM|nr:MULTISPECIES: hypothetical protein [Marinobacter]KXJ46257.1 MAG: hypothetical protein AXW11_10895 [Marinobacter sp. Hex_13]MDC8453858.1 hypothetical protein [Marinobacter sp. DS40M6]SFL85607.1 hypothetical protein SAMN04487868_112105 [Marinobacter salarius]
MKNVNFVFYHPHLDLISDRTIRSLLKRISTILREIQYQEVAYLIRSSETTPSQKQSLRDRLDGQLNHIEAYYLERLERGSLTLTVTLTAFGIWLLQQTIGESIKEAWQQSNMHKELVAYLSGPQRKEVLDRNIDRVLDGWTFDNYVIEDVNKTTDEQGELTVRVDLSTPPQIQKRIEENSGPVTIDSIIEDSRRIIITLNKDRDA